jgi:RNA recognition motif-containing protein
MELPWSDFIATPPSFSSASQFGAGGDCAGMPMQPVPNFAIYFPDAPPYEPGDGKPPRAPSAPFPGAAPPDFSEVENRSLSVANLPPSITDAQIQSYFNPCDSAKSIDRSALDSGVLTIEYFDLRHATQTKRNMGGLVLGGAAVQVSYAPLPKIEDPKNPPNNGTIVVFHLPPGVTPQQIESTFGPFGDIKQVRGTPTKPNQRFIEY